MVQHLYTFQGQQKQIHESWYHEQRLAQVSKMISKIMSLSIRHSC